MKKFCDYCNEDIEVKNFQSFGAHRRNCKCNPKLKESHEKISNSKKGKGQPKIELIRICPKCGIEYSQITVQSSIDKNRIKKFCSRSCANTHIHTEESIQKISNSLIGKPSKYKGKERILRENRICPVCGKIFQATPKQKKKYCNAKCGFKNNGGFRKNSGSRGSKGWYKGYWCDSSWELAFVIYHLDHKIPFIRNKQAFEYEFEGKTHKYYPDFIYEDGTYVEIKGCVTQGTLEKIKQFPYKIRLLNKSNIKNILFYCKKFYGEDFIKFYKQ